MSLITSRAFFLVPTIYIKSGLSNVSYLAPLVAVLGAPTTQKKVVLKIFQNSIQKQTLLFLCSKDAHYIGGFLNENILQQIRFFSPFRHPQGHP